jgi:putative phosphoesterase
MRIALVSDTHLPRFGRALPRALVDGLRETRVDLILHAGDWTEPMAVPLFEAIAPVDGVAGNNDGEELHARFGTRTVRRLEGFTVGVTHGHLGTGATTLDRARSVFAGQRLDVLVFGHSHRPQVVRSADGTWLVNPGSPTDKRTQARYTWILLELLGGSAPMPHLVAYDDRRG